MSTSCAYGAGTTCCYIGVVFVVMNSIGKHILVTSENKTSDFSERSRAHTRICDDITNKILTRDCTVHVLLVISEFTTAGL